MLAENSKSIPPEILCCDPDPDSRAQVAEKLVEFGYKVLSTGIPKIASALVEEKTFAALVVCFQQINLAMISVIVEARRHKPDMPVLAIVPERGRISIPAGLADIVLVAPPDRTLRESLLALSTAARYEPAAS